MTELTPLEAFVLQTFTELQTAMKMTELVALITGEIYGTNSQHLLLNKNVDVVQAIYNLVEKKRIIEIEYPDVVVENRVKSFLIPTQDKMQLRINGFTPGQIKQICVEDNQIVISTYKSFEE